MPYTIVRKDNGVSLTPGNKTIRISTDFTKIELALPTKPRIWTEITIDRNLCPVTGEDTCNCGGEIIVPPPPPQDHPIDPLPTGDVATFVAVYKALPDVHSHGTGILATEHMDVLALVPKASLDKIAIKSGNWSDATIWYPVGVPTENQKVAIPAGIEVKYGQVSEVTIFSLRIDGTLSFVEISNSKLKANTIVVTPTGKFIAGTQTTPVISKVEVLFAGGNIDTAYDPKLLSKGLISHGEISIYGSQKTSSVKAENVLKGATQIQLKITPTNWAVGDTIAITGTHKRGWHWNGTDVAYHGTEDEINKIKSISGNLITLETPLAYSHNAPVNRSAYVANLSKNITFRSLVASPISERAHSMFMHSNKVKVYFAAFEDMGRTDKSNLANDVGKISSVTFNSNIKGRYPVHLHKTGTIDQNNPAVIVGCSVVNSPGWGFAHHSSHADFVGCVSYNVFGAGFAAEDGDETGKWENNLAIKSQGIGYGGWTLKDSADVSRHDNGRSGEGFFFAGRLVKAKGNVAAGTTHGFAWMHRSAPTEPLVANFDNPEIGYGKKSLNVQHPPIQGFENNEAFCNELGLVVIKDGPQQNHDVRSVFKGFTAWEVSAGVEFSYTGHYTAIDFDLLSTKGNQANGLFFGLGLTTNTNDVVFVRPKVDGFYAGAHTGGNMTFNLPDSDFERVFIDAQFFNCDQNYEGFVDSRVTKLSSTQLTPNRLSFSVNIPLIVNRGQEIRIEGTKTDSIGSRPRSIAEDGLVLRWDEHIAPYVNKVGYYIKSGKPLLRVKDLVADRVTGKLLPLTLDIVVNCTKDELDTDWSINNQGGSKFLGNL
jgi:hypothetical protein